MNVDSKILIFFFVTNFFLGEQKINNYSENEFKIESKREKVLWLKKNFWLKQAVQCHDNKDKQFNLYIHTVVYHGCWVTLHHYSLLRYINITINVRQALWCHINLGIILTSTKILEDNIILGDKIILWNIIILEDIILVSAFLISYQTPSVSTEDIACTQCHHIY